jgi:hypothetical protein
MGPRVVTARRRVLVTGVTSLQVGRTEPFLAFPRLLVDGLRALRTTVEQRPVAAGEDLSGWDAVIVFLAPLADPHASYKHGALYTVGTREDAIVAFDDWQVRKAALSARTMLTRGGHYLWRSAFAAPLAGRWCGSKKDRERVVVGAAALAAESWSGRRVLVPCHDWGMPSTLGVPADADLVALDPSPFVEVPVAFRGGFGDHRRRRWVLAALQDHSRWVASLGAKWPVAQLGYPRSTRATERDVLTEYATSAGVLMPPRRSTSLSGWWRARVNFAAAVGAVIVADPSDAIVALPWYGMGAPIVEEFTDKARERLALRQRETLAARTWTRAKYLRRLEAAVFGGEKR